MAATRSTPILLFSPRLTDGCTAPSSLMPRSPAPTASRTPLDIPAPRSTFSPSQASPASSGLPALCPCVSELSDYVDLLDIPAACINFAFRIPHANNFLASLRQIFRFLRPYFYVRIAIFILNLGFFPCLYLIERFVHGQFVQISLANFDEYGI